MPHATLRVSFPTGVWIGAISREFPDHELRILAVTPKEANGVALVEISGSNAEAVANAVEDDDSVVSFDLLESQAEYCLVQFETTHPLLVAAAQESGVPITLPLRLVNGDARWEVTTSSERLSELGTQLDAFGLPFSVESLYQEVDSDDILTEDQWEILRTALELGYYDVPRACTQYEVAEAAGVARSTCSETLHRAEGQIVRQFVDDYGPIVERERIDD